MNTEAEDNKPTFVYKVENNPALRAFVMERFMPTLKPKSKAHHFDYCLCPTCQFGECRCPSCKFQRCQNCSNELDMCKPCRKRLAAVYDAESLYLPGWGPHMSRCVENAKPILFGTHRNTDITGIMTKCTCTPGMGARLY